MTEEEKKKLDSKVDKKFAPVNSQQFVFSHLQRKRKRRQQQEEE